MTQNAYFKGHFVGSGPESGISFPPMDRLAELYGFAHFSAKSNGEVVDVLMQFIAFDGPAILEVFLDPMKALEPKVASMKREDGTMVSRPLEDMTPLLDREELASLMKIPLL
jgi:acetolactate synthase-1/2/3 large subunit